MAWTAPMTFADGSALTAAQLNQYLRDNLNETMTAKATAEGAMFFGSDVNEWVERIPDYGRVSWTGTTSSTSYADLSTVGPSVTVNTGESALIIIRADIGNNSATSFSAMGYKVTGASTMAAADSRAIVTDGMPADNGNNRMALFSADFRADLTPGSNTFTAQYRVSSGATQATFADRLIAVWPM